MALRQLSQLSLRRIHSPLYHPLIGIRSSTLISNKTFFSSSKMSSESPYKVVSTKDAPSAIGPYSQAVIHNGLIFCSGCIPFVPSTMQLVEGDIQAQTQQALDNLMAIIKESGSDKSHILKTTVFLKDMNDFVKVSEKGYSHKILSSQLPINTFLIPLLLQVNEIYEKVFAPFKPARSAVEVARLPRDVGVEIECIAAVKQ